MDDQIRECLSSRPINCVTNLEGESYVWEVCETSFFPLIVHCEWGGSGAPNVTQEFPIQFLWFVIGASDTDIIQASHVIMKQMQLWNENLVKLV